MPSRYTKTWSCSLFLFGFQQQLDVSDQLHVAAALYPRLGVSDTLWIGRQVVLSHSGCGDERQAFFKKLLYRAPFSSLSFFLSFSLHFYFFKNIVIHHLIFHLFTCVHLPHKITTHSAKLMVLYSVLPDVNSQI